MTTSPAQFLANPWSLKDWLARFGHRPNLQAELAVLEDTFSALWRQTAFAALPSKHPLARDLITLGGQMCLLDLAAEVLRHIDADVWSADIKVPMQGRLRCWNLYLPTLSEFRVAPILRPVGRLTWQPQGTGHGADYQVDHKSGVLVAEVKRVCTSRRYEETLMRRVSKDVRRPGPVFTRREERSNTLEDVPRLYKRVKYAAKQLAISAGEAVNAARRSGRSIGRAPGVLFLDLEGNSGLHNLLPWIGGWMRLPWARSIDLIVFFDYASRDGVWGTVAQPELPRNESALSVLVDALGLCSEGHFHVGNRPRGKCEFPIGF